jgi:hypothetical protein
MPVSAATPLTEEIASFIQGSVSIILATCDASLMGSVVFAIGCRVSPDRRRVTLLVREPQAAASLADVRATGRVAVNFSLPSTNRSLQLKGNDAVIEPLRPFDLACASKHSQDFIEELLPLREMTEAALQALFHHKSQELVAITFTPSDGFTQTPGPGAGARL